MRAMSTRSKREGKYVWANDNAMPQCELRKVGASEGAEERKGPKELEDLAH